MFKKRTYTFTSEQIEVFFEIQLEFYTDGIFEARKPGKILTVRFGSTFEVSSVNPLISSDLEASES